MYYKKSLVPSIPFQGENLVKVNKLFKDVLEVITTVLLFLIGAPLVCIIGVIAVTLASVIRSTGPANTPIDKKEWLGAVCFLAFLATVSILLLTAFHFSPFWLKMVISHVIYVGLCMGGKFLFECLIEGMEEAAGDYVPRGSWP